MGISSHLMRKNILVGSLTSQVYRVTESPSIFALGAEECYSKDIQSIKLFFGLISLKPQEPKRQAEIFLCSREVGIFSLMWDRC